MKKGLKGTMNIDFDEYYDQEDDIYYVSFKTGEPSYVKEIDDILLLEVGMFTNMPTGFRILNFKKHDVDGVEIVVRKVRKSLGDASKALNSRFKERESQVEDSLEKIFA